MGHHSSHRHEHFWGEHLSQARPILYRMQVVLIAATLERHHRTDVNGLLCIFLQFPMAAALYYGEPIAIHMFQQDAEVAKVTLP